jgi:hypothetical protein
MDPSAHLDHFEATLKNQVAMIADAARSSPAGGGPRWVEIVIHFGLPDIENRGQVAGQRKHPRGAFPEEVESVMGVLAQQAHHTLQQMLGWGLLQARPDLQPRVQMLQTRLASLAEEQRKSYEDALAPKKVTGAGVGGIFANAMATKQINPWADLKYDQQYTLSCPGCGAPQQMELEFNCRFCGGSMFGPKNQ